MRSRARLHRRINVANFEAEDPGTRTRDQAASYSLFFYPFFLLSFSRSTYETRRTTLVAVATVATEELGYRRAVMYLRQLLMSDRARSLTSLLLAL